MRQTHNLDVLIFYLCWNLEMAGVYLQLVAWSEFADSTTNIPLCIPLKTEKWIKNQSAAIFCVLADCVKICLLRIMLWILLVSLRHGAAWSYLVVAAQRCWIYSLCSCSSIKPFTRQMHFLKLLISILLVFTQNACITLRKAAFLFLWLRLIFPNFYTENKSINRSWWLRRTDVAFVWHNNNNNGWEAHYLCLSAPSAVGQTRHNLNCTNSPTNILKYVQNQLWCCFNSLMRRINSTSLSLGGAPKTFSSFSWKTWWWQNLHQWKMTLFFFLFVVSFSKLFF